jgi:hypothetical protein
MLSRARRVSAIYNRIRSFRDVVSSVLSSIGNLPDVLEPHRLFKNPQVVSLQKMHGYTHSCVQAWVLRSR